MPKVPNRIKVNGHTYVKASGDPKESMLDILRNVKEFTTFFLREVNTIEASMDDPKTLRHTVGEANGRFKLLVRAMDYVTPTAQAISERYHEDYPITGLLVNPDDLRKRRS